MLFNGKYYNKPGHLGMTRAELKEALQGGGGGGYDPDEPNKLMIVLTPVELMTILSGTSVSKQATFYDKAKFQPYMTVAVSSEPVTTTIFYATSYDDDVNAASRAFVTASYVSETNKTYIISAIRTDADTGTFSLIAAEL